jgi:dipeptide/tripeptide permease
MINLIEKLFRKIPVKFRFMSWVAAAFLAALCWVNIDSAGADKMGVNWLLWVLAIILSGLVLVIAYVGVRENKKD